MANNATTLNWGMIGCGAVTEKKSGPAFTQVDGSRLHAVYNRTTAKAHDYAKRHGIPKVHESAAALIEDPEINAVYIATPPDSHVEYAQAAARAGKITCIEKPMARSFAECQQILAAFEHSPVPLFVAYYRRSLEKFQTIKRYIDSGALGVIRCAHWSLLRPPSDADRESPPWRVMPNIAGAGYFFDVGSHGIDLMNYFFGPVDDAFGVDTNQQRLYPAEDAIAGAWRYRSGVVCSGLWNFGCGINEDRMVIDGSEGRAEFSVFGEAPVRIINGKTGATETLPFPYRQPIQLRHVENMVRHLRDTGYSHPSLGESAAETSWVMDRLLGRV